MTPFPLQDGLWIGQSKTTLYASDSGFRVSLFLSKCCAELPKLVKVEELAPINA